MASEDMTYYLVISHKFLKLTGKYDLSSVQIILKLLFIARTLDETYIDEANYNGKGRFLKIQKQLH